MSTPKPIVVVGSIVQDLISYTDAFPRPGESVRGKNFHFGSGGKGANQCAQAAKLGADVTIIACVGNDMFGDANLKDLKNVGVNVEYVEKSDKSATATASITVDKNGENTIVVTLGANLELSVERVHKLEIVIEKASIVMCQFEIQEATNYAAFEIARKHGITTFYNAAPGKPGMDKKILEITDILCTNENETEFLIGRQLSGIEDFKAASRELLQYGPKTVVVTLGPRGVIVTDNETLELVEVPKVQAVDTTGAGDSFCGSLAYLIAKYPHKSVAELSRTASKIASLSVLKNGTQSSYCTAQEITDKGIEL